MTAAIFIFLTGVINYLRGWGSINPKWYWVLADFLTSKGLTSLYTATLVYLLTHDLNLLFITWAGMWLWAGLGWGKYFMAFSGNISTHSEKEVAWIDWLTDKIYGTPTTKTQAQNWGAIAFSLRGLHIVPLFVALAIYLNNYQLIPIGVLCGLMMGPIFTSFRWIKSSHPVGVSHFIFGLVIGGALWQAI